MVGVGETDDEISEAMQMLRDADVHDGNGQKQEFLNLKVFLKYK